MVATGIDEEPAWGYQLAGRLLGLLPLQWGGVNQNALPPTLKEEHLIMGAYSILGLDELKTTIGPRLQ